MAKITIEGLIEGRAGVEQMLRSIDLGSLDGNSLVIRNITTKDCVFDWSEFKKTPERAQVFGMLVESIAVMERDRSLLNWLLGIARVRRL